MTEGKVLEFFEIYMGNHNPPARFPREMNPEQGYPPLEPPSPTRADGTFDRTRYLAQSAFLAALYTESPSFLEDLHRKVYPLYERFCLERNLRPNPPKVKRIPLEAFTDAPLTFPDLDASLTVEEAEIKSAICQCLDRRDLWHEWFITFVLDLMHARFLGALTSPPQITELRERARRVDRGQMQQVEPSHWQATTYSEIFHFRVELDLWDVAEREFADIEAQIDLLFKQEKSRFKEHHRKMRAVFLAEERKAARSVERYRWLVRRLILRESYEEIATALNVEREISAVTSGVTKAARELGISLEPYPTEHRN